MRDILEFIKDQKEDLKSIVKSVLEPGSRGGIIVRFLEDGFPLYASQVSGLGDSNVNNGEFDEKFGKKFNIFSKKPYEAIAHLRIVKEGYVPGAFQRSDIGSIDLIWGNEKAGLCHIISKRESENYDINKFLLVLPKIIENGIAKTNKNDPNRVDIIHENPRAIAVISLLKNERYNPWLITSFKLRKKAFERTSDAPDYLKSTIAPKSAVPDSCLLEEIYSSFINFSKKDERSQEQILIQKSSITSNPIICDACLEYEQQIARLFESEEALKSSGLWDGEDRIKGDQITDIAVWPGKSNAGRGSMSNWWFCAPAHPNCSHEYNQYSPSIEIDELNEIFNKEKFLAENKEYLDSIKEQASENKRINRILNRLDRESVQKSLIFNNGIYRSGIYEAHTCAHDHSDNCNHGITEFEDDNWLNQYLDWRLKK
ncbi:MAG: hypothetical protein GW938_07660 [Leptospira sp.]|nr:hypothetical protein [Leptospira sp.]